MKQREGFTLMELLVASVIFSFVIAALVTISSTAHRHMFQSHRSNVVKTGVLLGMRSIQNNLSVATRLDVPAAAGQDDRLAFAVNVDQTTGCYPVGPGNVTAHYYCLLNGVLYHHAVGIAGDSTPACSAMTVPGNPFTAARYPVACGPGGGGTVTLLTRDVVPVTTLFSRRGLIDGVYEMDTVMVRLRSVWSAAAVGADATARDVDFSMNTVVKMNRAQ